jgi:tRNA dimethylallyltransferase
MAYHSIVEMLEPFNQPSLILTGPTAVGKSRLALDLAKTLGAEIISADSQQVYRGLDIGTAKPSAEDRACIAHHGIDIRNIDEPYNMGDFLTDVKTWTENISQRGKPAFIVGGTGFYLRALCEQFEPVEAQPDPSLREGSDPAQPARSECGSSRRCRRRSIDPSPGSPQSPYKGS